jgi:hypothetical protein
MLENPVMQVLFGFVIAIGVAGTLLIAYLEYQSRHPKDKSDAHA